MDWAIVLEWLDNPILVKHARSRLRRQPLFTSLVVVQVLCLCIMWAGFMLNTLVSGGAFELLAILQGIILIVMGGSQVSSAMNDARASGILDFHRVSPLSATELTLGFFFGAPIREYILFASTLPYAAICLAVGAPTLRGLVQVVISILTTSWIFHGLFLLNALISRPRASTRGAVGVVVVFLFILFIVRSALRMSRFVPSGVLFDDDLRSDFYGYSFPWLVVVLFFEAPLLFFLFIAASRKMESERLHSFTKLQALGALGLLGFLTLGVVWRQEGYDVLEISVLYILTTIATLLTLTVTPRRPEYLKGLWRAGELGRSHLHWWDDLALNRVYLFLACLIVLASGNVAWLHSGGQQGFVWHATTVGFPLAVAMAVLVVAYFGLALQFFLLRYGARGKMYFGLFLFFTWLLPLVAGTILAMATAPLVNEAGSQVLFSLSPVVGLATIALPPESASMAGATLRQAAAITPALLFAFVFNRSLIAARRRIQREFERSNTEPVAPFPGEKPDIAGQPAEFALPGASAE